MAAPTRSARRRPRASFATSRTKSSRCWIRRSRDERRGELLGVGGSIPVVAKLADAPAANTLLIGIAPSGGKLPPAWRKILLEAIDRGMNLVSGLHDFLSNDPEIAAAAAKRGVEIHDVRKNNERDVSNRKNLREDCLRIHTVGQDCSVGKMLASVEIALASRPAATMRSSSPPARPAS